MYHGGAKHTLVADAMSEAVEVLSTWATATACRHLSLQTILTVLTGALLELQVVFVCPDLGVLSAVCLSMLPLLQPFAWQSLLLPVLPSFANDFLQAPVPFILGVQYRTETIDQLASGLLKITVYRDHVKNASRLPKLPGYEKTYEKLEPLHAAVVAALDSGEQ